LKEGAVVHVVDDDLSFLRSMQRRLVLYGYEVATHASVEEFLRRPSPEAPGCVLTDLQMPQASGFDLQQALARSANSLPVVFISSKGDVRTTVKAMRGGAEDFLTKRSTKAELISAIDRAMERGRVERTRRARRNEARQLLESLSERESQVLDGVLRGRLNKEIADTLGLAERTVKHHRTAFTHKLGFASPIDLARLVAEAEG
jgi:FixJ family two-component response regulator